MGWFSSLTDPLGLFGKSNELFDVFGIGGITDVTDDIFGLDPNGGGIFDPSPVLDPLGNTIREGEIQDANDLTDSFRDLKDDVLGADPNGGGIFDWAQSLGGDFGEILAYNLNHLDTMTNQWAQDPERMFLGINTPLESEFWGEITGKDYEATLDNWGGARTGTARQTAIDKGIDPNPGWMSHEIAKTIAGIYAGQAASGAISGAASNAGWSADAANLAGKAGSVAAGQAGKALDASTMESAGGFGGGSGGNSAAGGFGNTSYFGSTSGRNLQDTLYTGNTNYMPKGQAGQGGLSGLISSVFGNNSMATNNTNSTLGSLANLFPYIYGATDNRRQEDAENQLAGLAKYQDLLGESYTNPQGIYDRFYKPIDTMFNQQLQAQDAASGRATDAYKRDVAREANFYNYLSGMQNNLGNLAYGPAQRGYFGSAQGAADAQAGNYGALLAQLFGQNQSTGSGKAQTGGGLLGGIASGDYYNTLQKMFGGDTSTGFWDDVGSWFGDGGSGYSDLGGYGVLEDTSGWGDWVTDWTDYGSDGLDFLSDWGW